MWYILWYIGKDQSCFPGVVSQDGARLVILYCSVFSLCCRFLEQRGFRAMMRVLVVSAVSPWILQPCWPLDTGFPNGAVFRFVCDEKFHFTSTNEEDPHVKQRIPPTYLC